MSVVSVHVDLNGLSVHMKNRTMEYRSVHWFGLTDLNETMRKICAGKVANEMLLL